MPERFAMKISEEILAMAATLTGVEESPFEDNTYVIVEPLAPAEFKITIMDEDSVFEAFKNDSKLHIIS